MTICTPIISLDLETTGLDPTKHVPWEIAWTTAIHFEGGTQRELHIYDSYQAFLAGVDDAACDPVGLDVGGFHRRYPQSTNTGIRPWHAVQQALVAHLDQVVDAAAHRWREANPNTYPTSADVYRVHLVGAVPQFDNRMLERWLGWSHSLWHYHLIDVETLIAGRLGIRPPFDTDEMTRLALGDDWNDSRKHEAAADVEWNLALYARAYDLAIIRCRRRARPASNRTWR